LSGEMQAWSFDRFGGPEVLRLIERPRPVPGPGEVLIELKASGINPSDVKNLFGHFKAQLPRTPGRDYAGVIVAGDGREGEEVWGSGPGYGIVRDGMHATHVLMPSRWVPRKPRSLSMEQAAAIGVPYLAAWSALIDAGQLREGETLLITGASGAVGRAAVQIAHSRKARVIGADRSADNVSGADLHIDTSKQDLTSAARELTGGRGVDLVLDGVGGPLFEPALRSLRKGGRQVAIASNPQQVQFNLVDFYHGLNTLIGVDTAGLSGDAIVAILDQLRAGFDGGTFQPPQVRTWAFADAVQGYQAVLDGKPLKHVLTMP